MQKYIFIKFFLLFVFFVSSLFAQEHNKSNVLFLHSYHPSSIWTQEINRGMRFVFDDPDKYDIYIEYMDTKRFSSSEHYSNLKNIYKEKYKNIKFDIILASDNNAFNFLKKYNSTLFKEVPVVFCGVNYLKKEQLEGYDNFVGVSEETDLKANYDLILKLHPNVKTIYNLIDSTTTGKTVKKQMQGIIKNYENKNLKFEFLDKLTMKQLLNKLKNLTSNSVILHNTYFKTEDNKFLDHFSLKKLLNKNVKVPIYTTSKGLLGKNIIGGYMITGFSQGKTAANLAKRILDGSNVKDMSSIYESPNNYIFDYNQIKKFNIDEKILPSGSIFLNKELSPFEIYFKEIVSTIVLFIMMIIFIIILLLNINKRKKAEIKIRKQLTFQQNLIDNVNTPIYYKNTNKEFIGCNKAFEEMVGLPREKVINKKSSDLINKKTAELIDEKDNILLDKKQIEEYEISIEINNSKKDLILYKNLFYEDGQVGGIVGAIFDITESKSLSYELNRMLKTLDKNVIIAKTDSEGKIFYVSKAFCQTFGYAEDELIGKNYTFLAEGLIDEKVHDDLDKTIKNKKIWQGELLNRSKSGELIYLYVIITPEYDKNGDFVNYTTIFQDITTKKQIEKAKNEIENLNIEISDTQKEVVFRMGAIAEVRSKETGNHVKRVAEYSKILALKYGLSEKEAEILRQASPMHDIGKVAISDAILKKPGKLTEEEFEIMKTHTTIGYEMLKGSDRPILKAAAIVAHEHQEKWNGSGYPRGLKEENIHIYGRITAVADVFDALGSSRCYKNAWEDEKIFELFRKEKAKHFDPKLIDIFFDNLDEFLEIREKFKDF
ncbi:ABC transporter substrate binding protein [Arcobacter sp. CECT 8985]|uniref:ABC transporter substrate binding protein n=1 Tax=Arcobacter sp. CECT 8985 TaxID=1935424 RepID=UPI00100A25A4|nr:ABC transporter substrate binding protein [Arcobacter sp. CECT 8985]RXJ86757.1 hypothetical protein CRU93_07380 [Arcobacter sp. CECT 8985]